MSAVHPGYAALFPHGIQAESSGVYDSFQESVRQCYERFEELYSLNKDLFPSLHTQVEQAFSYLETMAGQFVSLPDLPILFQSEEDANELIHITVLDIKQAILDYATLYMERCLMKRSLANEQETEEYQPEAQEYTPPGNGKKKRPNLPAHAKDILSSWFSHHVEHPYPTQSEKVELSERTGLSLQKVDNWFINERSRKWQSYRRK